MYQLNTPAWFEDECYDLVAKLPEGAWQGQVPAMLRALLVERFQMKVRQETRTGRVYALTVAKSGPRLKEAKDPDDQSVGVEMRTGRVDFKSVTLDSFSSAMSILMAHPVVNGTAIPGHFDIVLNVTAEDLAGIKLAEHDSENKASSSIFTAIQELGLKLESRSAAMKYIVVERAEKIPAGN